MLLNIRVTERLGAGRPLQALLGIIAAIGLGAAVVGGLRRLRPDLGTVLPGAAEGTVYPIGRALLGSHLFAFEFVSLLLAAAIVGAVYLARRELR